MPGFIKEKGEVKEGHKAWENKGDSTEPVTFVSLIYLSIVIQSYSEGDNDKML